MKGTTLLQALTLIICAGLLYNGYKAEKEFEMLHMENQMLWEKIDSLQNSPVPATTATSSNSTRTAPAKNSASSLIDEIFSDIQKEYQDSKKESARRTASVKIAVESSYRIEDRYVSYKVDEPDIMPSEPGVVVVDVTVDRLGNVKKTQVNSATTITEENVIDACRKAALKTDFNYISSAPENQPGTITYTFKKK